MYIYIHVYIHTYITAGMLRLDVLCIDACKCCITCAHIHIHRFIALLLEDANIHAHKTHTHTHTHTHGCSVAEVLLGAGARLNATNMEGNTALHVASEKSQPAVVRCLMAAGVCVCVWAVGCVFSVHVYV